MLRGEREIDRLTLEFRDFGERVGGLDLTANAAPDVERVGLTVSCAVISV